MPQYNKEIASLLKKHQVDMQEAKFVCTETRESVLGFVLKQCATA